MNIIKTLQNATQDLLMPSESDFPFKAFHWPSVKVITPEILLKLTEHDLEMKVEETDLAYLFRNVAVEKEWHNSAQKNNVIKFQNLKQEIESNLSKIKVYRVGIIKVDIYIVGQPIESDGIAGLTTTLVET